MRGAPASDGLHDTAFAQAICGTISLKLLKIGALVRFSVRRVKIAMASACPAALDGAAPKSASHSPPWRAPRPYDTRRRGAIGSLRLAPLRLAPTPDTRIGGTEVGAIRQVRDQRMHRRAGVGRIGDDRIGRAARDQ
jgi:hypothetical protein